MDLVIFLLYIVFAVYIFLYYIGNSGFDNPLHLLALIILLIVFGVFMFLTNIRRGIKK